MIARIDPQELREWLRSGKDFQLLDVREPWEFEVVRLPQSVLIPLGRLSGRFAELDRGKTTVTLCHHGVRSLQAAAFLVSQGFTDVRNLTGGIDAYALEADSQVSRY